MNFGKVNINPGIKTGLRQPYTIVAFSRIFFLTHDESRDVIAWTMFVDPDTKEKVEEILKNYLTNQ